MPDREKVINGLECCLEGLSDLCSYKDSDAPGGCKDELMYDTLALLKERELNEDWISRKRLRDEIQYYIDEAGWGDEVNKVLGWCLEFIDNQEAVKWE